MLPPHYIGNYDDDDDDDDDCYLIRAFSGWRHSRTSFPRWFACLRAASQSWRRACPVYDWFHPWELRFPNNKTKCTRCFFTDVLFTDTLNIHLISLTLCSAQTTMPHGLIWGWHTGRWWLACYIWYHEHIKQWIWKQLNNEMVGRLPEEPIKSSNWQSLQIDIATKPKNA